MKKLFTLCAAMVFAIGAMAQQTITPTVEKHYRTNASEATNWNSGYPKDITASGTVELSSSARIFMMQQFDLSTVNWDNIFSMTLTYTRGGTQAGYQMAAWLYKAEWTTGDNFNTMSTNINTALGAKLSNGEAPNAGVEPIFYANRGSSNTYAKEFTATEIQAIKNACDNGKLNLLVTSTARSGEEGSYSYSINAARTDVYNYLDAERCAKLVITPALVKNNISGKKYATLDAAISEATDGDELIILNNIAQANRINCDSKALTIRGATGNEVITLTNSNNMLLLATNNGSTNFTIENLIIDGNNYSTAKNFIEASGKMTIKNCTIRNYTTSNGQGVVVSKAGGNLTLEDVTFDNCQATATGIVYRGASLTVKKNISFTNCSETEVYIESNYLRAEEIAWTTPLKIFRKSAADGTLTVSAPGASGGKLEEKFIILNEGLRLTHSSHYTDMTLAAAPTVSLSVEVPYATFFVDYDAVVPAGLTAYKASSQDGTNVYFSEIEGNIPANEGVLLVGDAGTYTLQTAIGADAIEGNILVGTTTETTAPANCYAMSKSQSQAASAVVFAPFTGTLPANKAYFVSAAGANIRGIFGQATAINGISTVAPQNTCFNLNGQRVNNMTKGIVIVNGKKYLNK